MTAPIEAPANRSLVDILDDLDTNLFLIGAAADLVIDAAGAADIGSDLYDRLSFSSKVIEAFVIKARACSAEAFAISTKVSAILRERAA